MAKGHVLKVITEMQCYKLPDAASAKSDENYGDHLHTTGHLL